MPSPTPSGLARLAAILAAVPLAACDSASVQTACADPLAIELSEGEAAATRTNIFRLDCPPISRGSARVSADTLVIEIAPDTFRFSFGADGVLRDTGYLGPEWVRSVSVLVASFQPGDGRGQFGVVRRDGSFFALGDTLRGHFRVREALKP